MLQSEGAEVDGPGVQSLAELDRNRRVLGYVGGPFGG